MKTFKQFIIEKFVDAGGKFKPLFDEPYDGYEIFVNPNSSEINEMLKAAAEQSDYFLRFIFDYKKGKAYYILPQGKPNRLTMIHEDMMAILRNHKLIKMSGKAEDHWDEKRIVKDGFVGMVYKRGDIGWAESYGGSYRNLSPELQDKIDEAIFKLYKKYPEKLVY